MQPIILNRGQGVALVDDEDFAVLNQYRWRKHRVKGTNLVYVYASIPNRRPLAMHRVVMKATKGQVVDHINGDGLDNRKSNLRVCTTAQNIRNQAPNPAKGTSRYKGVYWRSNRSCWITQLVLNQQKVVRKHFQTEEDAAQHYDYLARKHFGEFARLNFPQEVTA